MTNKILKIKKIKLNLLILLMAGIVFSSCKNEAEEENDVLTVEEIDKVLPNQGEDALPDSEVYFDNPGLQTVFDAYIELKNTLVESENLEAKDVASRLDLALTNMEVNENIKDAVEKIEASVDLEEQREAFFVVSQELEKMVEGSVQSGIVYKQYCPMAFNDQGAFWLSTSQIIQNPYFGDKMLRCGSVKKTYSQEGAMGVEN